VYMIILSPNKIRKSHMVLEISVKLQSSHLFDFTVTVQANNVHKINSNKVLFDRLL
jgi:hypothetical protein